MNFAERLVLLFAYGLEKDRAALLPMLHQRIVYGRDVDVSSGWDRMIRKIVRQAGVAPHDVLVTR